MLTKAEIEAKLLPNGLPPADSPTWPRERAGSFNVYVCNRCRGALVVVLLDWGTTPFLVSCERGSRNVIEREALTHEDRARVFEAAKRETIEHVERGGLLLRDLTEPERAHWRATLAPSIPTKPGTGGRFA